jgi:ribonuclease VapC
VIVVDTSALMALLLSEPSADEIADVLAGEEQIVISAGTLAEALIVAERRGVAEELEMLLSGIGIEVDRVTPQVVVALRRLTTRGGGAGIRQGSILETVSRM